MEKLRFYGTKRKAHEGVNAGTVVRTDGYGRMPIGFVVMNYIHHNPVKHGYAGHWEDWPFSSASEFIEKEGRMRAAELWKKFPINEMGKGWDE